MDFRFFLVDNEKLPKSVVKMQSAQLKEYNIKLHLNGEKFNFIGFDSEYKQVILNIVSNAKDVLLEKNIENPIITIEVKNGVVTIEDNGGGIPENILDRIFEPYFTTKEQGKGTGMGLYMSKMIMEVNMNSILRVENIDSRANFIIEFRKY